MRGEIERCLLVNYRVDPQVAQRHLPDPFRPHVYNGFAIASVCLIRLKSMRPSWLPGFVGLGSENGAHRFAVEWEDSSGVYQTGAYFPRRDSDAPLNVDLGARAFPGSHHRADFEVTETDRSLHVGYVARDGSDHVDVDGVVDTELASTEVFETVADASAFFERGSLGYSTTQTEGRFDGLKLQTADWVADPVRITKAQSSIFDEPNHFPAGSITLDHALVIRNVAVAWEAIPQLDDLDPTGWPPRSGRG